MLRSISEYRPGTPRRAIWICRKCLSREIRPGLLIDPPCLGASVCRIHQGQSRRITFPPFITKFTL